MKEGFDSLAFFLSFCLMLLLRLDAVVSLLNAKEKGEKDERRETDTKRTERGMMKNE